MKLQTSIKPRRDGTVKLAGLNGKTYEFKPDEQGDMVCDVDDDATVVHVLQAQGDYFWPADEEGMTKAEALIDAATGDDDDDLDDGDDDADTSNPGGLPVEANTPPVTAPGKAPRKTGGRKSKAQAAQ